MKQTIFTLFLCLLTGNVLYSQEQIQVKSFKELSNDLDARVNHPKKDQNGKTCAIIKVVTTEQGFKFDGGSMSIVATEQRTGEIWVYVPIPTRKLSIFHEDYIRLRDYEFKIAIKEATCYEMVLSVNKPIEGSGVKAGFVTIESEPSGALIHIDGEETGDTTLNTRKLPYGMHTIKVSKPLYYDQEATVEVSKNRVNRKFVLKPAHGFISVTSSPIGGATVEIEGETGMLTTPCKSQALTAGEYTVSVRHNLYATTAQTVTVKDGETTEVNFNMDPRFARVTVNTLPEAALFINGESKSVGSFSIDLKEGIYDIEAKLNHHKSIMAQVTVKAGEPQEITLEPVPIYGMIDVISNPIDADVFVNGQKRGVTPLSIEQLLEGEYTVEIRKLGYGTIVKKASVREDIPATITATLPTGREVNITSSKSGAKIYINESIVGITPCNIRLGYGVHHVKVEKDYYMGTNDIEVTENGLSTFDIPMQDVSYSFGDVLVTAADGVGIYYNNELKAVGVWKTKLAAGNYTVETRQKYRRPAKTTFTVRERSKNTVSARLPESVQSQLKVESEEEDVAFKIEEKVAYKTKGNDLYAPGNDAAYRDKNKDSGISGVTPATIDLPSGEYTVIFSKKHFKKKRMDAAVPENETGELYAVLNPKQYVKRNSFFIGGGFQTGMGSSPYISVGGVIYNVMLEAEYTFSDNTEYSVSWKEYKSYKQMEYTIHRAAVRFGYQFKAGRYFAFVPSAGFGFYALNEDSDNESTFDGSMRMATTGMLSCRVAYHPAPGSSSISHPSSVSPYGKARRSSGFTKQTRSCQ